VIGTFVESISNLGWREKNVLVEYRLEESHNEHSKYRQ
jgi:hypothetical protein